MFLSVTNYVAISDIEHTGLVMGLDTTPNHKEYIPKVENKFVRPPGHKKTGITLKGISPSCKQCTFLAWQEVDVAIILHLAVAGNTACHCKITDCLQ